MTDASGAVVWAAEYKPFGEVNITTNTITNNLRFPGQYYDAETGLNQNWWRDYNPPTGLYLESDRLGIRRGTNHLYIYAKSNPLLYTDIEGSLPNFGGGAFGVGGGVFAGGFSFDFEECCKGNTKYQRTLLRTYYGLGAASVASGGGSWASRFLKGGFAATANLQIFGPGGECSYYKQEQKISCFSASLVVGVDICDSGSGKIDTLNINVGTGMAVYTVFVNTAIVKEVAVGCCKK